MDQKSLQMSKSNLPWKFTKKTPENSWLKYLYIYIYIFFLYTCMYSTCQKNAITFDGYTIWHLLNQNVW